MNQLEGWWFPLHITAFVVWACSLGLAAVLLVRASSSDRRRLVRLGAIYMFVGALGIVAAVELAGQHYSYTDVMINDELLGFDLDFGWRHGGIAVIAAWWARELAAQGTVRVGWVIVLAAAFELLMRADNIALFVALGPSFRYGEWVGALLPPIAGAIGIVAWDRRLRSGRADQPGGGT